MIGPRTIGGTLSANEVSQLGATECARRIADGVDDMRPSTWPERFRFAVKSNSTARRRQAAMSIPIAPTAQRMSDDGSGTDNESGVSRKARYWLEVLHRAVAVNKRMVVAEDILRTADDLSGGIDGIRTAVRPAERS
jgi:hypothetical protein